MGPLLGSGWALCPVLHETIPPNLQNKDFPKATNPCWKRAPSCFRSSWIFLDGVFSLRALQMQRALFVWLTKLKKATPTELQPRHFQGNIFSDPKQIRVE